MSVASSPRKEPVSAGESLASRGSIDPDEAPRDAVVHEAGEETDRLIDPPAFSAASAGRTLASRMSNGDEVAYVLTANLSIRAHVAVPPLVRDRGRTPVPPVTSTSPAQW